MATKRNLGDRIGNAFSRTWNRNALAVALAACLTLATSTAIAQGDDDDDDRRRPAAFCTATAHHLFGACTTEVNDDFFKAKAICTNVSDEEERKTCFTEAKAAIGEEKQLCGEQRKARIDLCGALGEARYDPSFESADFDTDFANLTNPNRYFPLKPGNKWKYQGNGETIRIEVLNKIKLIEGVTCIVVNDLVEKDGQPVEDTDDWFGQRKDGTVDYCGESVKDFETFEGDNPMEAELVSIDGSFKAGRDGDKAGTQFLGNPTVGAVYRQEFSATNAEDAARILSTSYGYGGNADLDSGVPRALALALCRANDCVVISEFSPIEPSATQRKYYAAGIGLFLDVKPSGEKVQLVECSFDSRCAALPAP